MHATLSFLLLSLCTVSTTLAAPVASTGRRSDATTIICDTHAGSPLLTDALLATGTLAARTKCAKPAAPYSTTMLSLFSANLSLVGDEECAIDCAQAAEMLARVAEQCQTIVDGELRTGGRVEYTQGTFLRLAYDN